MTHSHYDAIQGEQTPERLHFRQVARDIGGEISRQYGPPTLDAAKHHLAEFTNWQDCVDVLGEEAAIELARVGFYAAEIEKEEK